MADDQQPTELARPVDFTEAQLAWSDAEPPEVTDYRPRRVRLAIGAALAMVAAAGGIAVWQVQRPASPSNTALTAPTVISTVTVAPAAADPSPPAPKPTAPAPVPSPRTAPAGPVALPVAYGSAHVRTASGRTVCQITPRNVECNVDFTVPTPFLDGMPATGVAVAAGGSWQWLFGDPGDPDYTTMQYGTVYQCVGWTVTPTSDGTTFMNNITGHGITVSVEGFQTF